MNKQKTVHSRPRPKPEWLKVRLPAGEEHFQLRRELDRRNLHSICQSARCPNIAECWKNRHATFLIMGSACTRNCGFCAVKKGPPRKLDPHEPQKILEMAELMELKYLVITSVTRDDLEDGGSSHFAAVISTLKKSLPHLKIEVLIPDFQGRQDCIDRIIAAGPAVINHNIETVQRVYHHVNRAPENYHVSLSVLHYAARSGLPVKSGIMVGLGETSAELAKLFVHLRSSGVSLLTIGQYCQPTSRQVPVSRFYTPDEFRILKKNALKEGFTAVESGPLVRSSYKAEHLYRQIGSNHQERQSE